MFPSWNHSRTLRTAVVAASGKPEAVAGSGTADPASSAFRKGEDPGEPGSQTAPIKGIKPTTGHERCDLYASADFGAGSGLVPFTRCSDAMPGGLVDADWANYPA